MAAVPLAHAWPAGHGTELFVACGPQSTPAVHGVQLVAARPPAEKVPGVQGLGGAPPPGQAVPAGHGTEADALVEGQKTPAAHGTGGAPPPAHE